MAMNIEGTRLKVSTTQLRTKSEEVARLAKELQKCMDEMHQKITATNTYWIGDAGDMHRRMYEEQSEEIDEMLRRINEHPVDLISMADVYDGVEKEVTQIAQSLDGDVIE